MMPVARIPFFGHLCDLLVRNKAAAIISIGLFPNSIRIQGGHAGPPMEVERPHGVEIAVGSEHMNPLYWESDSIEQKCHITLANVHDVECMKAQSPKHALKLLRNDDRTTTLAAAVRIPMMDRSNMIGYDRATGTSSHAEPHPTLILSVSGSVFLSSGPDSM